MSAAALACVLLAPGGAAAQAGCPARADSASARPPDVVIRATVTLRELRFDAVPSVRVRDLACPDADPVVVLERTNLPDPVEPGVTYRDVRLGVEVRTWLDVRCLVPPTADGRDPCAFILYGAAPAPPPDTSRANEP